MEDAFIKWSKGHHSITEFVVGFCRHLRTQNFSNTADGMQDALKSLSFIKAHRSYLSLKETLKIVLCKNSHQFNIFDELFDQYWQERKTAADSKEEHKRKASDQNQKSNTQNSLDTLKSWLYNEPATEEKETSFYSTHRSFEKTDFIDFSDEEKEELSRYIERLGRTWALQRSRRNERSQKGKLDIRQLIRKNMNVGGELLNLTFQKPKKLKTKLVILCDVSRSMQLYSRFFIQFAFSLQSAFRKVKVFSFATELHELNNHDWVKKSFSSDYEMDRPEIHEFGSGTNIGGSLAQFADQHVRNKVDKNTYVIIMSDGWDVADAGLVGRSMRTISKSCKKIIWLNPLMAHPDFQPETQALKEALPYIGNMLPIHNVASLKYITTKMIYG